jgi:DNA-binding PadR family transcriptional regulator
MDRELLLLGLLRQGEMYGYQLHDFIDRNLAFCTDLKKPTAYHLLSKLAQRGWIVEVEVEAEGHRPPRRVYQITPAGEAAFQRLLRDNLSAFQPAYFTGDIGLAFLDALPAVEARALLAQRRAALAAALAAAQAAPVHGGSMQLVVEHQARHLAAELDWLDEVIARWQTKDNNP